MCVREPEVHQQNPATLFAHDVAGLDVPVQKTGGVNRACGAADVDGDERRFAGAHRTVRRQEFRERLTVDEVAPESQAPLVPVDAIDRHDVRVPDAGDRSRFTEQRVEFLISIESARQQELQSDVALERRIERAVDFAERAAPDALQILKGPPPTQRRRRLTLDGRFRLEFGIVQ